MRALTPIEVSMLRGEYLTDEPCHDVGLRAVAEALEKRGCFSREAVPRGFYWVRTPLGRLALRVAVALPAVSP